MRRQHKLFSGQFSGFAGKQNGGFAQTSSHLFNNLSLDLCWTYAFHVHPCTDDLRIPYKNKCTLMHPFFHPPRSLQATSYDIISHHLLLNRWRTISDPQTGGEVCIGNTLIGAALETHANTWNTTISSSAAAAPINLPPSEIWSGFQGHEKLPCRRRTLSRGGGGGVLLADKHPWGHKSQHSCISTFCPYLSGNTETKY